MSVERIQDALQQNSEYRFQILYGEGLNDTFITHDLQLVNIEAALHSVLKNQGFQRIAFLSPHQPVHFLDTESQERSTPAGLYDRQPERVDEMRVLRDGPLSSRFLLPVQNHGVIDSPTGGMGDVHALRLLDTIIRDGSGPKSAIVFTQAETTLQHFEDQRTLSGLIGSWARLPSTNGNKCFLLFAAPNRALLSEIAPSLPVPEIRDSILANPGSSGCGELMSVSAPGEAELDRLLQMYQAQNTLAIDEDSQSLSKWLSSERVSLRQWISRLDTIEYLDRATARRMGWISAVHDPDHSAEERLAELIGLHRVKQHISEMSAWLYLHLQRDQNSDPPLLHLVFTGNPGTGKTTVARLVGEIYRDLGLLKRGHLVEARAADLIAGFVGGTSARTDQVIDQALDGVLFIDEAYILTEPERGGFGQEAVDTLLSRMENDRSRLVVIVAGYPEKMRTFLQSNPGLNRRFPIENHYDFADFTTEELSLILYRLLAERAIPVEDTMRSQLNDVVQGLYESRDETFGNAGEVRNLCEAIDRRRAARILRNKVTIASPLEIDDLPEKYRLYLVPPAPDIDSLFAGLDDLVGLHEVKSTIRRLAHRLELEQIRHQQLPGRSFVPRLQHMVFSGNPGTGKTTVARLVGQLYRTLGLLKRGHVVEVSRVDLVAGYVGQTALKTMERVKAALDGVLFIDEAYSLMGNRSNDFGQEVIDTLVKAMEDFRGRLIVIVAGYPQEMDDFLGTNPGLRSRFSQPLIFPDFTQGELVDILARLCERDSFILPPEVSERVMEYLEIIRSSGGQSFGNARTVQAIFECMKDSLAERVLSDKTGTRSNEVLSTFYMDDVPVPAGFMPALDLRIEPTLEPTRRHSRPAKRRVSVPHA
jgi:SpoVK/Ycf46/Vps4 family AAA+-type ATPase